MKVLCINNVPPKPYQRHDWFPNENGIYTVKKSVTATFFNGSGEIKAFLLYEDPLNNFYGWPQDWFIPLSDIDETELVNQREEECIQ